MVVQNKIISFISLYQNLFYFVTPYLNRKKEIANRVAKKSKGVSGWPLGITQSYPIFICAKLLVAHHSDFKRRTNYIASKAREKNHGMIGSKASLVLSLSDIRNGLKHIEHDRKSCDHGLRIWPHTKL